VDVTPNGATRDVGSGIVDADGNATIVASALTPGEHAIHAVFSGNAASETAALASSVSPVALVNAEATGAPSFTATASPSALTVTQGDSGETTITLTPQNGFSEYVTLSCVNPPPDSTCTFLPVNVFVGAGTASTSVLSIETYGPTGPKAAVIHSSPPWFAFLFPGLLGVAGLSLRKRSGWNQLGLVLLAAAGLSSSIGLMTGCSQRYHYLNKAPAASTGTPLGSTALTIQAQAVSGVTVTTQLIQNFVLTVQAP
jgi:hypothetical protein